MFAVSAAGTLPDSAGTIVPGSEIHGRERAGRRAGRPAYGRLMASPIRCTRSALVLPGVPGGLPATMTTLSPISQRPSRTSAVFRVFLPLADDRTKMFTEVFVGGESSLGKLPANQPVYFRGGIDWAKLLANVETFTAKKNGATASAGEPPV